MTDNFDRIISREGTSSIKYDARSEHFSRHDVLPLWIADMDFAAPEAIQRALIARASHPIYGYTVQPESAYTALTDWLDKRYHWAIKRDWVMLCPGVVPSLHASIYAFTQVNDAVIVQPPVYAPFLSAPNATGRKLILSPLKFAAGCYRFDFENLERHAQDGAKFLLLCSPHNPVGRVWKTDELQTLLDICQHYGITVLSDEIHADLTYPDIHHTPLAKLAHGKVNVITAVAPSKTFNIPGLGLSALIVPNAVDRTAITRAFDMLHISASNPFSIAAFEAAYREGASWLESLLEYLAGTRKLVEDYLLQHLPDIKLIAPEGTYLLWLDCRSMQLNDQQLKRFFVLEAGVGLTPGTLFGEGGSGFMRMNIAAPRSLIIRALEQISRAEHTRK